MHLQNIVDGEEHVLTKLGKKVSLTLFDDDSKNW
jgi:hypothetical protein